jgi:hypothetical protein
MINPADLPTTVAGLDWRNLKKGEVIMSHKIIEMFHVLFSKNEVLTAHDQYQQNWYSVRVKDWLEKARNAIQKPLVFKQRQGNLVVLTDAQAVGYLNGQAYQGLNKHRKSTRRMFTQIDADNLSQHDRDELQVTQARHAFISSAADGARRQTVKILKQGGKLPILIPPDL